MKFEIWSVIQFFRIDGHGLINFFMNASAIFDDVACLSATEYLVSKFCIVSIYELSIVESHDIHWYLIEREIRRIREDHRLSSFYAD